MSKATKAGLNRKIISPARPRKCAWCSKTAKHFVDSEGYCCTCIDLGIANSAFVRYLPIQEEVKES